MKLFIFPQYQRMMDHFRAVANGCAIDKMRFPICRVEAKDGAVQLLDHTMNVLALTGGETQIAVPEIIPGKARQFCLRLTATGENMLTFTGAAFESDTVPAGTDLSLHAFPREQTYPFISAGTVFEWASTRSARMEPPR